MSIYIKRDTTIDRYPWQLIHVSIFIWLIREVTDCYDTIAIINLNGFLPQAVCGLGLGVLPFAEYPLPG
jgi:hypothetical protein